MRFFIIFDLSRAPVVYDYKVTVFRGDGGLLCLRNFECGKADDRLLIQDDNK